MAENTEGAALSVLVADDKGWSDQAMRAALSGRGFEIVHVAGVEAALGALSRREKPFSFVLTSVEMLDGSGLEILQAAHKRSASTQVLFVADRATFEVALEATQRGAYDFIVRPFSDAEIGALINKVVDKCRMVNEVASLKARLARVTPPPSASILFGDGPAMGRVNTLILKAASTRTTVLITGESGTGKGRVARALHDQGPRATGPYAVVNCGALPEQLIESELFGHEKGAFTGAVSASRGLFREADGGTLFLDEIAELPAAVQVKLLRALQERRVRPVGSTQEVPVDVRVVAATNRDIEADVASGRFRKDLYYRLNIIRIDLPPLRKRDGQIGRLAESMVGRFSEELGRPPARLSSGVHRALDAYDFPGNIRELENMMERAAALRSGDAIELIDLPDEVSADQQHQSMVPMELPEAGFDLDETLDSIEAKMIRQALARTNQVRSAAAALLGISMRSLRYRLRKLGIHSSDPPDGSNSSEPPAS